MINLVGFLMADIWGKAKRSEVMSRIRGGGNQTTEVRLMKLFRRHGIKGWRRHLPILGTPDFVFNKEQLVVFVDGCFWHGCPNCYREPRKNTAFWKNKVVVNQRRDRRVSRQLREKGWKASSLPASCRNQLRSPDQRPEREDTSFCVFP